MSFLTPYLQNTIPLLPISWKYKNAPYQYHADISCRHYYAERPYGYGLSDEDTAIALRVNLDTRSVHVRGQGDQDAKFYELPELGTLPLRADNTFIFRDDLYRVNIINPQFGITIEYLGEYDPIDDQHVPGVHD